MLPQDWARIVALLDGERAEEDPLARLQRLCGLCVEATGTSGAALVISANAHRSTVWATDRTAERLQELQLTFSEGPAVDALEHGRRVMVPDLSDGLGDGLAEGWPWFAPAAVQAGAEAVFAWPLQLGHIRPGVLSLYRAAAGQMSRGEQLEAELCAEAAALLLTLDHGQQGPEAFLWVVDDRTRFAPQVPQAVGALRVQLDLEARDAFARLCAHAFLTDTPIGQVADDIMAGRLRLERDDVDRPG